MKARIDALEKPVAFTARFKAGWLGGLGVGQTLKWDDVRYNAGSGYDHVTGLFTAPASGTYIFYLQLMQHNSDATIGLGIYQDAKQLALAQACCSADEVASTAVTVHLDK